MMTKLVRTLVAGATLAASGGYTFVYLYRWEWNRALMSAAIFIAAEVAVMGWLLAERLRVVNRKLDAQIEATRGDVHLRQARHRRTERIHETAPPARVSFEWLARPGQMNVFVPVLMGAGVLMSGLAWVVERIARRTVSPVAERGLAAQLDDLALPPGGFVVAAEAPTDLLRGPARTVGWRHP
jgi:uncharacterized protein YndB with AHSA1/START domain